MGSFFKKPAAILLAAVLMIPSTSSIGFVHAAETGDSTVLVDEKFEGASFDTDIQNRGATIKVTEQTATNHELTVSGRTADWNGIQIPFSGQKVTVSMKVRSANTECVLGIQYLPSGSKDTKYDWIKNFPTTKDSYVEINGSVDVPAGATDVKLFLNGNGKVNLENIMVDDIKVTVSKTSTSNTSTSNTSTKVEDFEGSSNIALDRGATLKVVDGTGVKGTKALLVSGRKQNWQGVNFDAKDYAGQTVSISAQVKSASTGMKISIQIGEGDGASYSQVAQGKPNKDNYVTLSGTYQIPSGKSPIYLYIEADDMSDFYVDDFTIVTAKAEVKAEVKTIQENLNPLKTHMASTSTIDGKMGVAISSNSIDDAVLMKLVTKHFSSVTCENEMKPESILGATPTLDKDGNPVLSFKSADKIMDYILAYNKANPKDIIRVRGHVLLWHSQTPSWFFKEKYSADGAYVSKEEMLKRMDSYFKQVIEHFDGAGSKYAGLIYAWDVVNEQIDNGGIRVSDGGSGTSNWYQIFKGDNTYIKEAFRIANKYAPPSVKLFYNDFGETDTNKCNAICQLITEIKAYTGTRIDGMGMQAHYNMLTPSADDFAKAVRAYSKLVGEIQITELDLQSSNGYDGTNKEAEYTKQAYRYKDLFDKMYELDKENGINISSVTMWGVYDGASWLNSSSSVGGGADGTRKQCPLLFDDAYQAKPAYYGIVDSSKLEPFTKNVVALYSAKDNWTIAPKTTYEGKDTKVTFQTIWSGKALKVKVTVTDKTAAKSDKIVVYVDKTNSKSKLTKVMQYQLTRGKAKATKEGYTGIITIPLKDSKVGTVLGFDVAVTNNDATASWNDYNNTQTVTSKYYAELTMKPYAELKYGTVKIDGKLDNAWKSQSVLPITVKTGSPSATANVRAMWDSKYLYIYAEVTDKKLSKANANAWEQDSIEIFLDQNNGKTSAYEADDCQYRINYKNEASFNGTKCNADNLKSVTKLTKNGYIVEAAIKLTDVKAKNGTLIGVDFQINDDAGSGSRAGTYNWFDKTGTGYANPSVFGTVTLIKKK